jgi:hypothetical protein
VTRELVRNVRRMEVHVIVRVAVALAAWSGSEKVDGVLASHAAV